MYKAAAIVNSRPLTVTNILDPVLVEPLTPNHLETMESKIIFLPEDNSRKKICICAKDGGEFSTCTYLKSFGSVGGSSS